MRSLERLAAFSGRVPKWLGTGDTAPTLVTLIPGRKPRPACCSVLHLGFAFDAQGKRPLSIARVPWVRLCWVFLAYLQNLDTGQGPCGHDSARASAFALSVQGFADPKSPVPLY